jgi:hypothetical protein
MKNLCLLFLVLLGTWLAAQEKLVDSSTPCSKTVSFAVAEHGQPVPAIPKVVAKWISVKKHTQGYPELCFSQIPSSVTTNYLVIFATAESSFQGLTPTAHTYNSAGPEGGAGPGVGSYGGTWSYSYSEGMPSSATSTLDLRKIDNSKKELSIRGYDQHGRQLFDYSVNSGTSRDKLLEQGFADIHRDPGVLPPHKRVIAPLSVYYVNCDVGSSGQVSTVASINPVVPAPAERRAVHAPPPRISLDLSSDPTGADIYIDDVLTGKTPLTTSVTPGEHEVAMRKADFSSWSRKLHIATGPRHIVGHLERKVVNLSSAEPGLNAPQ